MNQYLTSLFVLILLLPFSAAANDNRSPASNPDEQQKGPAQFRAEVDQVVVYVAVYDRQGQLVTGLSAEEFTVFENKVEQEITYFGQDDVPSTVGIVMDRSGSMRNKIDMVNAATRLFLTMNHPENELFLISFKDEVALEEPFTRDPADIRDALDNLIVAGGTALWDAIYLGVDEARKGIEPRRVLVVFTDGEDKDSYYRHEEVISRVEESDVQVHMVAFLDADLRDSRGFFGLFRSEKQQVEEAINQVAEASGGKAFFPEDVQSLRSVFESIARDLRSQYRIAYVSSDPNRDGSWRRIDVRVRDAENQGYRVRAKKGYFSK